MGAPRVAAEIIDFYTSRYDEDARLSAKAHGVLEFIRTQELLRRYLPAAPAMVLDIGGGPATHARWLTADGYSVHLVDPVERHLRQARARCQCTTELGDARTLTATEQTYDVTLLLGPLYHLPDRADRLQALREAHRVLRPGGLIAAAVMRTILDGGHHSPTLGFTTAYFHTVDELTSEMTEAGFTDVRAYGIEGPIWPALKAIETHIGEPLTDSPLIESAATAARLTETDPAVIAASGHILAIGHRPPIKDH